MDYLITNRSISPEVTKKFKLITKDDCLSILRQSSEVEYDSETSGLDPHLNDILLYQFGINDGKDSFVIDAVSVPITEFKEILENTLLIGHNLKFDTQFLFKHGIVPSKIFDTFLAEKTLHLGIKDHGCALDDCVLRYFGIELDKSEQVNIKDELTLSKLIYASNDVKYLSKLRDKQMLKIKEIECENSIELDNRFCIVLAYVEYCGIKLDKDKWIERLDPIKKEFDKQLDILNNYILDNKLTDFIDKQLDLFSPPGCSINWNSSIQVIKFFKSLGIHASIVENGEEKDTVNQNQLIKYVDKAPIIQNYIKYKECQKELSTYGENWFSYINLKTGRIHSSFKQLMNTGRLSSGSKRENKPNLQNIPSDKETRSCFVSEPGYKIIGVDYSGQEQVVLANTCLDKNLLEFYDSKAGDMHAFVASKMYKELYGLTLKEIKDKHKDKRQAAKIAGFAINYGGSPSAIADQLNVSIEDATKVYNGYFEVFPGLKDYYTETKKFGIENGFVYISTLTGKRSYVHKFDEFKKLSKEFDKKFWDKYKLYKAKYSYSPWFKEAKEKIRTWSTKRGEIERMSLNYGIQGQSAEITKLACVYFWSNYLLPNNLIFKVKIINLVHDEIVIEVPDEIAEEAKDALVKAMEDAGDIFCQRVKLTAEATIDNYWKK